jgi:hypothetical protein
LCPGGLRRPDDRENDHRRNDANERRAQKLSWQCCLASLVRFPAGFPPTTSP